MPPRAAPCRRRCGCLRRRAPTGSAPRRAGRPGAVALAAAAIGAAIALAALGPLARRSPRLLLRGGAVALAAMLARRQIGGYTGDVLGVFQQIGEIVMLLVAAAR